MGSVFSNGGYCGASVAAAWPLGKRARPGDSERCTPNKRPTLTLPPATPPDTLYVCRLCNRKSSPRPATHRTNTVGDGTGEDALKATVEQRARDLQACVVAADQHDRTHPPQAGDQPVADYCLKYVANSVPGRQLRKRQPVAPALPGCANVVRAFLRTLAERHEGAAAVPQEAWRSMWPCPVISPLHAGILHSDFDAHYESGACAAHEQSGGSCDSKWMPKPRMMALCRYADATLPTCLLPCYFCAGPPH